MALTDAERQQRRRDKLKNLAEQAKYDPKQFVARSVRTLYFNKKIDEALLLEIKNQAILEARKSFSDYDKVKEIFIKKNIDAFFETKEDNV